MGISAPITFRNLKILKSYISMSLKIIAFKYIGRYLQEGCMQKSAIKKHVVFWNIKRQISDSK
jgi:hypothetical protein